MTIHGLQARFGFTQMPFGRGLDPRMLHRHTAHAEATARIGWCIEQRALGVITGEVGAGKTVAVRAALAALDPTRHATIYLGNPSVGVRGINNHIVTALGGVPRFHHATLVPQAADALAAEAAERGRTPILIIDEAHLLSHDQLEAIRMLTNFDLDLLTELPELFSQFSEQTPGGAVTVPDHDRTRRAVAGPGGCGGPEGGLASDDRRSVGALPGVGRIGRGRPTCRRIPG